MPRDNDNATLIDRLPVHEDLAVFRVKYNDQDVPDFQPGQFATLGLPDTSPPDPDKPVRPGRGPRLIRRAYSIASPTWQKDALDFYIVRVGEGKLTPSLWDLEVGQTLYMNERITGHFTLEGVPTGKTLIMVSTGTGLAPFRSMLLTFKDQDRWDKLVLFDGCREARDLGYLREMEELSENDPRFVYLPTVTREHPDSSWPGLRGRVTQWLEPMTFESMTGAKLDPDSCQVFLCGNPAMIDQVEAELGSRGFVTKDRKHPDGNLHFERYW